MMFGRGGNRDADECVRMVHRSIDAGINLSTRPTATGSATVRQILGRAVADRRDQAIVASKCFFPRGAETATAAGVRALDHACV
jgi:aryl-alcohol dehydrogenase-like predicted oxidoreductase